MRASRQKTDTVDPAQFAPGQRWISETQAELGLGLVLSSDLTIVQVHYPAAQQTITYAARNAPLRRVFFEAGDTIVTKEGEKVVVREVKAEGKCFTYISQFGEEIPESQLSDKMSNQRPEQRLLSGSCDDSRLWSLRQSALRNRSYSRASDVRGLTGGRISLIPHQLYIAENVAKRYAPRVLLADEVGLGKTIEACLILHRLHLSGRANRILILVPDALVNQWFVELYRRFALSFAIFDEERAAAIENGASQAGDQLPADFNPFFDDQLVLCALSWIAEDEKRAGQAIAGNWDLLIVDEAHHLEWSVKSSSREYDLVESLAEETPGLLLLTATPEQLGREGHFARLRLLDPARFSDLDEFVSESEKYQSVSDLAHRLGTDADLNEEHFEMVTDLLGKKTADLLRDDDTIEKRLEVQNSLVDLHGPGRVLFRNRRIVLDNFPERRAHLSPIPWEESGEDQTRDDGDAGRVFSAKIDWLVTLLKVIEPEKILLIVHSKEEVVRIEEALRDRISATGAVFHEDLSLLQRDKNAAWFGEEDGARILICSEIGSEGRNFQFAHHLVLFDLPPDPALLEQRIGRLDRIGQSADIHIHVPCLEGSGEEFLARWYHEGLGALENTLHGASAVFREFRNEIAALTEEGAVLPGERQFEKLLRRTRAFKEKIDHELESGRDRLLELSSFDEERGRHLVQQIEIRDEDRRLEYLMLKLADHFGVTVEDLDERSYCFLPEHLFSAETFPGLPEEGLSLTFDREKALNREEMVFLSTDHPMVIGSIDSFLASDHGNAAFFRLENAGQQLLMIEVVSVLECVAPAKFHPERFLSPHPIRALVDQKGRNRGKDFPVDRIRDNGRPGPSSFLREKSNALRATVPPLLAVAQQSCEDIATGLREDAVVKMKRVIGGEIVRLERLKEMGHPVREQEIELAREEMAELEKFLLDARLRVDSVRLILALA